MLPAVLRRRDTGKIVDSKWATEVSRHVRFVSRFGMQTFWLTIRRRGKKFAGAEISGSAGGRERRASLRWIREFLVLVGQMAGER